MSDDVTNLPRETGNEKSSATCPTCGEQLPVVSTPYGSTVAGACPNCVGGAQLEAQKAAAEGDEQRGYPLGDPSEEWKGDQLQAFADAAGVDLAGSKGSKAAMLEAIGDARPPEPENPQA